MREADSRKIPSVGANKHESAEPPSSAANIPSWLGRKSSDSTAFTSQMSQKENKAFNNADPMLGTYFAVVSNRQPLEKDLCNSVVDLLEAIRKKALQIGEGRSMLESASRLQELVSHVRTVISINTKGEGGGDGYRAFKTYLVDNHLLSAEWAVDNIFDPSADDTQGHEWKKEVKRSKEKKDMEEHIEKYEKYINAEYKLTDGAEERKNVEEALCHVIRTSEDIKQKLSRNDIKSERKEGMQNILTFYYHKLRLLRTLTNKDNRSYLDSIEKKLSKAEHAVANVITTNDNKIKKWIDKVSRNNKVK